MQTPTASALLDAWERGADGSPVERALALVAAASPGEAAETLARWPIGERDRRLLALRETLFGPRWEGVATCPACGEQLELTLTLQELLAPFPPAQPSKDADDVGAVFEGDGYEIRYRLPNSLDMEAASGLGDRERARQALLARCVLGASAAGQPVDPAALPDRVLAGLADAIAQADPLADLELALTCPACGQEWVAPLDIAAFLWAEVEDWAKRLLRDVHTLASAYGWREADILALSPWRRQVYLELAAGA